MQRGSSGVRFWHPAYDTHFAQATASFQPTQINALASQGSSNLPIQGNARYFPRGPSGCWEVLVEPLLASTHSGSDCLPVYQVDAKCAGVVLMFAVKRALQVACRLENQLGTTLSNHWRRWDFLVYLLCCASFNEQRDPVPRLTWQRINDVVRHEGVLPTISL